ncbi:restriction endonuclease subunit S [Methyloversatilis discipulorum]|uniref:restriction endonuclease subunit S n=1 Tax=Methyloversatilis discipulorum TaxID=1119528 RepID=UPI003F3DE321
MRCKSAAIGDVPEHWHVGPLRDVLDLITYGFTNPMPDADEGPWKLTAKDIVDGQIRYETARRTTEAAYKTLLTDKSRPRVGDVLLTKDGSIGRVAVADKDGLCINQSVALLRPNARVLPRFLAFLLRSPYYQQRMEGDSDGSTIKHIYITRVDKMEIALPPVDEQAELLAILGTLDDRIDLLRQTNATLESIAQALFKSWFIDFDPVRAKADGREPEGMDTATAALFPAEFEESALGLIPKGWGVQRLSDVLELAYGKALKATDRRDGQVPVYGSGGITGFHDEALVQSGSIIVGRKGTVGSLYWEDKPFFPIDTTFYVKPKAAPLTFCFYALQRLGLESMNTDAAVPGLNRENAYRLELISPGQEALRAFDDFGSSLRATMRCNDECAALLAGLRDTLLPRLISGKLRLPEAHAPLEDAMA